MNLNTARLLMELRSKGYSWRALAEVYYDPKDLSHGDQGEGQELMNEAAQVLGFTEHHDDVAEHWSRTNKMRYP